MEGLDLKLEFLFGERTAIVGLYRTLYISKLVDYNLELLNN